MSSHIRWEGKVRETGTRVQILDLTHPDSVIDPDPNRWATFCLDHGRFTTHPTSALAWEFSAHPLIWCEICNGNETPEPVKPKRTRKAKNVLGLPEKSFAFFTDLANDAGNWGGQPWLSGNVAAGRSASGMSQTLVRAGLIQVHSNGDDEGPFATFTDAGIEAAAKIGVDLGWLR